MNKSLMTIDELRHKLREEGTTMKAHATKCGVEPQLAYKLISGNLKGRFGKVAASAVKLGLKVAA